MIIAALFAACKMNPSEQETVAVEMPLYGTWELISATTTENDSTFSTFNPANKMIKIITPTHFAFFNHDQNMGKDSTAASFSSGGGACLLKDSLYTEHLDYCNFREWEGHKFEFTVTVNNDTLTQQGLEKLEKLGIDRVIVEKYKRVTE